jgi:hypothetical protein
MRIKLLATAGVAASALMLVVPTSASAATAPTPRLVSTAVAGPFNLAISKKGRAFVADGFTNTVSKVKGDGSLKTLFADATGTTGVALSKNGKFLAYTTTVGNETGNTASALHINGPRGSRVEADTFAHETTNNPDKKLTYGVDKPFLTKCVADSLASKGIPANYKGAIDSHAYSVTAWGKKWIVADAGGNDLLIVDRLGNISTLTVMPRQPLKISAAMASGLGLEPCVAGITYSFESVPTDVEVGKDGFLYVTTLPGGPEGPSLGARGRVYRVDPHTGEKHIVARGFLGATNLALGKHGKIYVSELFGNKISVIENGTVSPFATLPGVVAVETGPHGTLWAATLASETGPGSIVKYTIGS